MIRGTLGMRVIVQGRLRQRIHDTGPGDKRVVRELEVDEVGPSLRPRRLHRLTGLCRGPG
nr:hypothetical protein [Microbispora sp. KK1-11]